ncbi:MAG: S26 family signal peptidase [Planctomycetota bacterium]
MRTKTVRRVVRLVVFAAVGITLYAFATTHELLRIPTDDTSLDPDFPAGSRVVLRYVDEDSPIERDTPVLYLAERDGQTVAHFARIAALPGDTVESKDGVLYVNGESRFVRGKAPGPVPEGHVFLLIPNPLEKRHADSRKLGFIKRSAIKAIVLARMFG